MMFKCIYGRETHSSAIDAAARSQVYVLSITYLFPLETKVRNCRYTLSYKYIGEFVLGFNFYAVFTLYQFSITDIEEQNHKFTIEIKKYRSC